MSIDKSRWGVFKLTKVDDERLKQINKGFETILNQKQKEKPKYHSQNMIKFQIPKNDSSKKILTKQNKSILDFLIDCPDDIFDDGSF